MSRSWEFVADSAKPEDPPIRHVKWTHSEVQPFSGVQFKKATKEPFTSGRSTNSMYSSKTSQQTSRDKIELLTTPEYPFDKYAKAKSALSSSVIGSKLSSQPSQFAPVHVQTTGYPVEFQSRFNELMESN
mmetsp:Transcript_37226/g.63940  ORF Transcript_37226/g.63940 Transcript_37226/m.63940 type:complete len:130 (+) Transcript_37226:35-424(+)